MLGTVVTWIVQREGVLVVAKTRTWKYTLVACTFFISRGKWKGHYNDGRSNKDNSVVNWNKCSKQCVQNLFKSSFAGVYGKSLATPSKTQCNMFGCEEAKWKYENWIEHLNCHFWLSLSLSLQMKYENSIEDCNYHTWSHLSLSYQTKNENSGIVFCCQMAPTRPSSFGRFYFLGWQKKKKQTQRD